MNVGSVTFIHGDAITEAELKKHAIAIITDDNNNLIDDRENIRVDMSSIQVNPATGKVDPGNYNVTYTYKKVGYETETITTVVRVVDVSADGKNGNTIIRGTSTPNNSDGKPNDMYINIDTGDVYIKRDDNTWPTTPDINMKGQK